MNVRKSLTFWAGNLSGGKLGIRTIGCDWFDWPVWKPVVTSLQGKTADGWERRCIWKFENFSSMTGIHFEIFISISDVEKLSFNWWKSLCESVPIGGEALDLDQVVVLQVDLDQLVLKKYTGDYHDYVKILIISSQA